MNAPLDTELVETRRGTIAIGGTDVAALLARTLQGRWTYERNFLRVMTGATPDEAIAAALPAMFIALAAVQRSDLDLDMVRLAASTGAGFEHAILPAIAFADRLRLAATELQQGAAPPPQDHTAPQRRIAAILHARLAEARPGSPHLPRLGPHPGIDALAAALLLEAGVAPALAPFVAIAARLPALAATFLAERRESPNRFVGLTEGRGALPESRALEADAEALLAADAGYADMMVRIVLRRAIATPERRVIDAALISGAEYGQTAASTSVTRLMASTQASAVETYSALISTFGYYHLGALKECATIIERASRAEDIDAVIAASTVHDEVGPPGKPPRGRVAGFGHRFQQGDPRAALLLEMCRKRFPGRFIEAAAALDARLYERRIGHINMDGIGAAMGLQVGFPACVTSLLTLVARAPGIAKEYAGARAVPDGFALKARSGIL